MALNEPVLAPSKPIVVGKSYVIDGTHKIIVNSISGTVATLSASLPGSPSIRACDVAARIGGVYLAAGQGGVGRDIFET